MRIINENFDAFGASWWDRFYRRGFHSFNDFDRAKFALLYGFIKPGESVLDYGFGEGYFFDAMPDKDRKLGAVDWSEEAVEKGRKRYPDAKFYVRDLEKPANVKEKYDVGVCCEVLEHLKDPSNLMKALRSHKKAILTLPSFEECAKFADDDKPLLRSEFAEDELDYHRAAYTREDVAEMLPGCRFVDYPRTIIALYERP